MLYSLYLCISQSRLTPVTSIPQIPVALHNEILILTVTVQCRLMEGGVALHSHWETHTLSTLWFHSHLNPKSPLHSARKYRRREHGGLCRVILWASLEMVHITSAKIYRPELSDMMPPNCKDGLECSLGVCLKDRGVIFGGHLLFFATPHIPITWKMNVASFPLPSLQKSQIYLLLYLSKFRLIW